MFYLMVIWLASAICMYATVVVKLIIDPKPYLVSDIMTDMVIGVMPFMNIVWLVQYWVLD